MINNEKDLGALCATEADAVPCSVPADQLPHDESMPERSLAGTATMENRSAGARDASRSESTDSGSSFDCTIVGGDSRPDGGGYVVMLRIHAGWLLVPEFIRTMSTPVRVTFAKAEGRQS